MDKKTAQFQIGQVVSHRLFDYRGVIIDVDPVFSHSEEWYETMAKSRPPKDAPWYHVLVHDSMQQTYVAERNLKAEETGEQIRHPAIPHYFDGFENGLYILKQTVN